MYSVNVPVPSEIRDIARRLRPALSGFDRIRPARTRTLVLKRLPAQDRREFLADTKRVKKALEGFPPFEIRLTGVDTFRNPPRGPAPVAYLAVEGDGLRRAHDRLLEEFDPVDGLEGPDYTPHVTLARGGPRTGADQIHGREFDPVTITVDTLELYDSVHAERVESLPLPV